MLIILEKDAVEGFNVFTGSNQLAQAVVVNEENEKEEDGPSKACAPTGSGKTLAFLCPTLMKLKVMFMPFGYFVSYLSFSDEISYIISMHQKMASEL